MPYYGDYYAGDPGLFSGIGRVLGGVLKTASKILPGPVGIGARLAGGLLTARRAAAPRGAMQQLAGMDVQAARRAPARRRKKRGPKFGSAAWRRKYRRR